MKIKFIGILACLFSCTTAFADANIPCTLTPAMTVHCPGEIENSGNKTFIAEFVSSGVRIEVTKKYTYSVEFPAIAGSLAKVNTISPTSPDVRCEFTFILQQKNGKWVGNYWSMIPVGKNPPRECGIGGGPALISHANLD